MFQPLHNGAMGLSAQQKNLDTIGHNVANVNTQGFKSARMDFQDNLYTRMWRGTNMDQGVHMNTNRGVGVRESQTARFFGQGAFTETGRALDFALQGRGFFVFENPFPSNDPEDDFQDYLFSRSGTLHLVPDSDDEQTGWLVDSQGRYILDDGGDRISLLSSHSNISVQKDGSLYAENENGERELIARIWLLDFTNPGGLLAVGGTYFMQTDNSGDEIDLDESSTYVVQNYIESSNVDLSQEMTRLIRAQRVYQMASRCVTVADQMMQTANSIQS
ncbi:MAG: flagellar hook-basal body protein [Oscillospiraceae bacterium]|nr:flagellar hook-basal body protein [Oscillospiraceae bacterium]